MPEYYGVQRSEDYLAHYGIKGMKWGVQKAKESGNTNKLNRQYMKAQKKLQKLNLKADIDVQREYARKYNKRAATALGIGLAGLGAAAAGYQTNQKAKELANQVLSSTNVLNKKRREKKVVSDGKGVHVKKPEPIPESQQFVYPEGYWVDINGNGHYGSHGMANAANPVHSSSAVTGPKHPGIQAIQENQVVTDGGNTYKAPANTAKTIQDIGTGIAIAGLGTAAYQKARAIAAKHRTTAKGHAKAVAKRDAWQKEMQQAFKGTQFDHSRSKSSKKKRR